MAHTHTRARTHAHTHTHTRAHTRTHARTHERIHVRTHERIHARTHTYYKATNFAFLHTHMPYLQSWCSYCRTFHERLQSKASDLDADHYHLQASWLLPYSERDASAGHGWHTLQVLGGSHIGLQHGVYGLLEEYGIRFRLEGECVCVCVCVRERRKIEPTV